MNKPKTLSVHLPLLTGNVLKDFLLHSPRRSGLWPVRSSDRGEAVNELVAVEGRTATSMVLLVGTYE